jgi:hypothetical protein
MGAFSGVSFFLVGALVCFRFIVEEGRGGAMMVLYGGLVRASCILCDADANCVALLSGSLSASTLLFGWEHD